MPCYAVSRLVGWALGSSGPSEVNKHRNITSCKICGAVRVQVCTLTWAIPTASRVPLCALIVTETPVYIIIVSCTDIIQWHHECGLQLDHYLSRRNDSSFHLLRNFRHSGTWLQVMDISLSFTASRYRCKYLHRYHSTSSHVDHTAHSRSCNLYIAIIKRRFHCACP